MRSCSLANAFVHSHEIWWVIFCALSQVSASVFCPSTIENTVTYWFFFEYLVLVDNWLQRIYSALWLSHSQTYPCLVLHWRSRFVYWRSCKTEDLLRFLLRCIYAAVLCRFFCQQIDRSDQVRPYFLCNDKKAKIGMAFCFSHESSVGQPAVALPIASRIITHRADLWQVAQSLIFRIRLCALLKHMKALRFYHSFKKDFWPHRFAVVVPRQ